MTARATDADRISLPLVGYTDRLSVAPGDTIRFMVSSDHARYRSRLVRLIHGDTNPDGPGFKQVVVPSAIDGERAGEHHDIRSGSYAEIPFDDAQPTGGFTFTAFIRPTLPGRGEQALLSRGDPFHGGGLAVGLDDDGALGAGHRRSIRRGFGRRGAPLFGRPPDAPLGVVLRGRRRSGRAGRRCGSSPSDAGRTIPRARPSRSTSWPRRRPMTGRSGWRPRERQTAEPPSISTAASIGRGRSGAPCRARRSCASRRGRTRWSRSRRICSAPGTSRPRSRRIESSIGRPRAVTAASSTCRPGASPATTTTARRRTSGRHRSSTARSTSIATTSRTRAGRWRSSSPSPADLPSGVYAAWLTAGDDEDHLRSRSGRPAARSLEGRGPDVDRDLHGLRELHGHRRVGLARPGLAGRSGRVAARRQHDLPRTSTATSSRTRSSGCTTSMSTATASATARCSSRCSTCVRSSATGR